MLVLVLVALAPPTIVAVVTALDERHEARVHAQQDVLDTARIVQADVERVITGTSGFVAPLADDLSRHPGRRGCERLLALLPRSSNRFSSVGAAHPDGTLICGATQRGLVDPAGAPGVARAGWFRAARRTDRFVLARFQRDPLSGMGALIGAQSVQAGPGMPATVLFVSIDIRTLAEATALHDAPQGTTISLFDGRGTILARKPAIEDAVGKRFTNSPVVRTVLAEQQGTAEVEGLDGVKRIQGFVPIRGPGGGQLYVVAGRASSAVFADPDADLRRFIVLGLLGLGLALLLSYLATRVLLARWTTAVVDSARRFGAGDLTARAPAPRGFGEITAVSTALNTAAEEIERRQRDQAKLIAEVVAVEEETRRRIAADIHDDTAQAVAAAGLRMDALIGELTDPEAREAAVAARQALGEANRRLRRLLFELRPPALDEAGLAAALELFLSDSFSNDGFVWRVDNRLEHEPSPEARAVLYRVALEALTNVRKHAHARSVYVTLERRGVGVAVRIRDDGEGFDLPGPDAAPEAGHIGLVSMRERAEAAGGRFALMSELGDGTTVEFWLPDADGRPEPV